MKAEDILSAVDLKSWLETLAEDQALNIAPKIAHRGAMRVLPVWARLFARSSRDDLAAIPIFWCHILTTVAACERADLSDDVFRAATAAAANNGFGTAPVVTSAATAFRAAATDAAAAAAATVAGAPANAAAADAAAADAAAAIADVMAVERGDGITDLPLWPNGGDPLAALWNEAAPLFERHPAWAVFKDLYENTLQSRPQNWPLLIALAQKDEAFWTGKDEEVLDRIAGVMEGFAVVATYNGERVEVNPETQKLRLVGEGALSDDMGRYARRKMTKAIALFDDKLDNQYSPIFDAVRVVRTAIEDIENIPMELFDACGSATRMVASLSKSETIPSPDQDHLIGEFVSLLREVASDIAANDPKAQETVARRNSIVGNNALQVNAQVINFSVGQIVNVSEGALARELTNNAKDALDTAPETEAARVGAFKLSSRLLRVYRVLREVGENIAAYKELYNFACVLVVHPQMQQALQAILRYLGLG